MHLHCILIYLKNRILAYSTVDWGSQWLRQGDEPQLIGRIVAKSGSTEPPEITPPCDLDSHGQAALLLTESLLHGLVDQSIISVADAIEVVDIAAEVKQEMAAHQEEASSMLPRPQQLLAAIKVSLEANRARGASKNGR